ncbi:MAG: hypothetical protein ACLFVT_07670, partial [Syntrophobacteria bacterium]
PKTCKDTQEKASLTSEQYGAACQEKDFIPIYQKANTEPFSQERFPGLGSRSSLYNCASHAEPLACARDVV